MTDMTDELFATTMRLLHISRVVHDDDDFPIYVCDQLGVTIAGYSENGRSAAEVSGEGFCYKITMDYNIEIIQVRGKKALAELFALARLMGDF